MIAP
ncbi:hypothetical protein ECTW00353_1287, partial [Escherichia coli TW00353]|jgi:hypothetical protein